MTEAQEATPTMGEESAPKKDEMPSGPWADEGQGPQGDGDAPEVVWQDDEAVPTQQEPAQETPGPNLEAPNLNLEGGQPDGQPSDKGALEVPAHQGSQGSQGEVAATSPELLTQETSAPPRQGSVTSAKPQDVPFTSALPPSEPTSPQESQDGQKDEAPVSTPAVTIDVDSVKAVPTTKGDAKRSSESKKSEGRRGSLGSYRAETLLYDRLGVEPTATDAEIRNAYKRMALQLHPDKGGDPENFKLMREAYEVLSNHQKRTVYDLHGMEGIKCMEQAAQMEARMSDVTPVLLIMMELAQTNALMRGIVVAIATLLGSMVVLPFILLTLKWDGDTSFSWAVVFIPVWIFQLVILCCQHVFLSMQQLGAPDEEVTTHHLNGSCLVLDRNGRQAVDFQQRSYPGILHGGHSSIRSPKQSLTVDTAALPPDVRYLFFTLSGFAPGGVTLAVFQDPSVHLRDGVTKATLQSYTASGGGRNEEALVLCCAAKDPTDGRWTVQRVGAPSSGNKSNYDPLYVTVNSLVRNGKVV